MTLFEYAIYTVIGYLPVLVPAYWMLRQTTPWDQEALDAMGWVQVRPNPTDLKDLDEL